MRKPIVTALSAMLSAAIALSLTATASYAQNGITTDTASNTVQTQAQPDAETSAQPEATTQSETGAAEAQTQAPAQSETDTQPQTETQIQPQTEPETQPQSQAETTFQPEAQPESQPESEAQQDTATPLQTQSTDNTIRAAMNGYAHSASSDPQNGITLTAYWNDPKLGSPTTFHVEASGGSGNYQFRMDAPHTAILMNGPSNPSQTRVAANGPSTPPRKPHTTTRSP